MNWAATFIIIIGALAVVIGWQGTYSKVFSIITNKPLPTPCPAGTFRSVNGQCVQSIFSQWIQEAQGSNSSASSAKMTTL